MLINQTRSRTYEDMKYLMDEFDLPNIIKFYEYGIYVILEKWLGQELYVVKYSYFPCLVNVGSQFRKEDFSERLRGKVSYDFYYSLGYEKFEEYEKENGVKTETLRAEVDKIVMSDDIFEKLYALKSFKKCVNIRYS